MLTPPFEEMIYTSKVPPASRLLAIMVGLIAVSTVSAFVPQAPFLQTRTPVAAARASKESCTNLHMALTVADSRRKYLKYLIQASAAVLVSPWATPTYAEEADDDEEEEPVVEKPKPKKKRSKKAETIRTDVFELADIRKDPPLGPDGAPNPKTTMPLRSKKKRKSEDSSGNARGLPSTDANAVDEKPQPRNVFSFLPGQVDIPIISK